MPTYRLTIDRAVRFQLDIEADSRMDALKKVIRTALHYDVLDEKKTRIISLQELEKPILNSPD